MNFGGNKKIYSCSNIWHNLNGKIISKYKNGKVEKIRIIPASFKKNNPYTTLSPIFYDLLDSLLWWRQIKFTNSSPKKKKKKKKKMGGDSNYV